MPTGCTSLADGAVPSDGIIRYGEDRSTLQFELSQVQIMGRDRLWAQYHLTV